MHSLWRTGLPTTTLMWPTTGGRCPSWSCTTRPKATSPFKTWCLARPATASPPMSGHLWRYHAAPCMHTYTVCIYTHVVRMPRNAFCPRAVGGCTFLILPFVWLVSSDIGPLPWGASFIHHLCFCFCPCSPTVNLVQQVNFGACSVTSA